jgi:hypothetical protein
MSFALLLKRILEGFISANLNRLTKQTSIFYQQPHFDLPQIQGGQQIEIQNNLRASLNLREE